MTQIRLTLLLEQMEPAKEALDLQLWVDTNIKPGEKWLEQIELGLAQAKVAVLLVSSKFLASGFIKAKELPPILNAAENDGLTILWVAVSACLYEHTPIRDYQAANDPKRPLDILSAAVRNMELVKICRTIVDAAK